MNDPYKTLGVQRGASDAEIKAAYRKLAKKMHPDRTDNPRLIEKFKEVSTAYNILSNPAERQRYDQMSQAGADPRFQGQSGFGGQYSQGRHFYASPDWSIFFGSEGARQPGNGFSGFDVNSREGQFAGLNEMLFRFFGDQASSGRQMPRQQGKSYRSTITVSFLEAALGTQKRIKLQSGKVLNLRIPAGSATGQKITLRGLGEQKPRPGNLYLELKVEPHKLFRRVGNDIHLTLRRTELVPDHQGKVAIPTLYGQVQIKPELASDKAMRLKGLGIRKKNTPAGDLYLKLV